MIEDDKKPVTEIIKGNKEAYGMLVEKYQDKMFNLAIQITRDADASKDIVQDAFIKAYKSLKSFDTGKKFFSWIYRITLNETLNYKKRSGFSIGLTENNAPEVDNISAQIEADETALKVNTAINMLNEKYRSLIVLRHYQELSYEEISEILKLPVGKVKSRLYIAREILRKSLERKL